jgi:hypothetical protein
MYVSEYLKSASSQNVRSYFNLNVALKFKYLTLLFIFYDVKINFIVCIIRLTQSYLSPYLGFSLLDLWRHVSADICHHRAIFRNALKVLYNITPNGILL